MGVETGGDDLALSLFRVAADPARMDELHQLLRGFCHQFRNVLNSLRITLHLARLKGAEPRPGAWGELEDRCRRIELMMDRLQAICRPTPLNPVTLPFCHLVEERLSAWHGAFRARGRVLELEPPTRTAAVGFDPTRMGQALDALVEWRAGAGPPGQPARLGWRVDRDHCRVDWREPAQAAAAPLPAITDGCPGALALPLLARVAAAHGGTPGYSTHDGLHIWLRWPYEVRTPC